MSQSSTDAAIWTDSEGRPWSTAVTVNLARRVKELVDVDLLDVFDGQLFSRLADDPVLLVNTLYAVCKPQADHRDVSDEAFGELLVGDTIEVATSALVRGIIDFFPQDRRKVLEKTFQAITQVQSKAVGLAITKLDSTRMDQAIEGAIRKASAEIDRRLNELGDSFGNSPESTELTQVL